jgi:hypothetical protein
VEEHIVPYSKFQPPCDSAIQRFLCQWRKCVVVLSATRARTNYFALWSWFVYQSNRLAYNSSIWAWFILVRRSTHCKLISAISRKHGCGVEARDVTLAMCIVLPSVLLPPCIHAMFIFCIFCHCICLQMYVTTFTKIIPFKLRYSAWAVIVVAHRRRVKWELPTTVADITLKHEICTYRFHMHRSTPTIVSHLDVITMFEGM